MSVPISGKAPYFDPCLWTRAQTLCESYAKNDPYIIAKFPVCCRDKRSELAKVSRARMPDLPSHELE